MFPVCTSGWRHCMPARIVASAKMQLHICFQVGERHRCRSKQFKQSIQISMRGMNIGMPMGRENGLSTGARNKLPRSARKSRVTGDPGLRTPNALRARRLMQWLISRTRCGDRWVYHRGGLRANARGLSVGEACKCGSIPAMPHMSSTPAKGPAMVVFERTFQCCTGKTVDSMHSCLWRDGKIYGFRLKSLESSCCRPLI